jgi:hypothetical protein
MEINYLSIDYQDCIYDALNSVSSIHTNIISIIINYLTDKTSWKRVPYDKVPYYVYIPKTFTLENGDGLNSYTTNEHLSYIYRYYQFCQQLIEITSKYIDERNIWNYTLFNDDGCNKLIPLVSSNTKYHARYYSFVPLLKNEDNSYRFKLVKYSDAFKEIKISLFPSDKPEKVISAYLYLTYNDIELPISELIQKNENTFTLPNFLSSHPYYEFYVKFKIENDILFEKQSNLDRMMSIEEIFLNYSARTQILNDLPYE